MNRLISELEGLVADLAFTGTGETRGDIKKRLELIYALFRELGMDKGEALCRQLSDCIDGGEREKAAELLCALGCYLECIKNM